MHTPTSLGKVIIVESPSTATQLSSQLSRLKLDCTVLSTKGHLFNYTSAPDGSYALLPVNRHIVETISSCDRQNLVIATDSDRQGELIARHIKQLTPNSKHERCLFNDLSLTGVHKAMEGLKKGLFTFQDQLADEATMIKLINLRMQTKRVAGFYATTTSIELAKQWDIHRAFDSARSRTYEIDGKHFHCALPQGQQLGHLALPTPVVTKDIILQRSLTNRSLNTMDLLQERYLMGRLSYIRTDYSGLPLTAANTLQTYTLDGLDIQHTQMLTYNQLAPHYAIYNLAAPKSEIEILVALQNRSALTQKYNDVLIGTTESGAKVFLSGSKQHVLADIRPEQEIAWLLAQSKDSSPSNIETSANKYCKHFFNGHSRNDKLIGLTQEVAIREYPTLWENGLNELVQTAIAHAPSPPSPRVKQEPSQQREIREFVHDLSL